nr:hypothetical protein [Tanacetum cinerariifolium]
MRTVASISATGIPQKSLIDHGLYSFWSHVVRVVVIVVVVVVGVGICRSASTVPGQMANP